MGMCLCVDLILSGDLTSAEEQHHHWLRKRIADGWSWGETRDPETKKHPALCPWSELDEVQRFKSVLYRVTVLETALVARNLSPVAVALPPESVPQWPGIGAIVLYWGFGEIGPFPAIVLRPGVDYSGLDLQVFGAGVPFATNIPHVSLIRDAVDKARGGYWDRKVGP
jgi:hypothetical protein